MKRQTEDTQNQRQEIELVGSFVRRQVFGHILLRTEVEIIDRTHTALPVAVELCITEHGLLVVLPAYEVPHEVAHIHVVQLVTEEVTEVIGEGWFLGFECLQLLGFLFGHFTTALAQSRNLILDLRHATPDAVAEFVVLARFAHAREEGHVFFVELVIVFRTGQFVFLAACEPFLTDFFGSDSWCIEIRTVKQRAIAVLFTVDITEQVEHVLRVVHIDRRIADRTNHHHGVG